MAFSVGQKLIAPSILGGAIGGGYSLNNKIDGDYTADPISAAKTGAMLGLGVGGLASSGAAYKGISKKVSMFTEARNSGASKSTSEIFNQF